MWWWCKLASAQICHCGSRDQCCTRCNSTCRWEKKDSSVLLKLPGYNSYIPARTALIVKHCKKVYTISSSIIIKTEQSKSAINRLYTHLTKASKDNAFDQVNGEWLLYMLEDDNKIDQWIVDHSGEGNDICGYWSYISSDNWLLHWSEEIYEVRNCCEGCIDPVPRQSYPRTRIFDQ